jgi:superfamily II DNA or RNA helicase
MKSYFGKRGYTIVKDKYSVTEQNAIRKELTIKPFNMPNAIQKSPEFPVFRESSKKIYMPRFYGYQRYGEPEDTKIHPGKDIDVTFNGGLRELQTTIVSAYLKERVMGCGLIEVPPGYGKTVMGLNIISQLQKKTLIILHKEFLVNQWLERIEMFLPNARVGKIQGQIIDIHDKDIVLGMLQSLSMKDYPDHVFEEFGLTIVDECFPGDTYVITSVGMLMIKDLEEVEGAIKILSHNHDSNKCEYKVLKKWKKTAPKQMYELQLDDGTTLEASYNHRIYCVNHREYVMMRNLKIGDVVRDPMGTQYNIVTVRKIDSEHESLYDIEVEDNHNFFASQSLATPILVHNCHHIAAEVFSRSLFKIVSPNMLGLSATMNRKDGLTKVFKMFLGDVVYKVKPKNEHQVIVKAIEYKTDDEEFNHVALNFKGQVHYSVMISKLCNYSMRSEFILKVCKDQLDLERENQQIMILAHNKSLLKYLHDAIEHRNIATVGYYVGGMKQEKLKESESKKIIIATYAMAEEGLDIKSLTTLIMATPRTDVTQAVGRILRAKHSNPVVIDIVDTHDIFEKQWLKRQRYYNKSNYKIVRTDSQKYVPNIDDTNAWDLVRDFKDTKIKKKYERSKKEINQGKCLLKIK